jgi:large subunit ribosomal protein L10
MVRPDKVTAVAEIAEKFRSSSASVVTEYRGLSMARLTTLRRSLGEGTTYRVAKNTLVQRAAEDAGVEGLEQMLVGPTAIAFITGEPVDAAKAIRDFARTNPGLVIKGGFMDGRALTVTEVNQLAELESREVLLAKLAGAMKANLSKAAGLFAAPASQVARLAQALADKRAEEEGGSDVAAAPAEDTAEAPEAAEAAEAAADDAPASDS